jgi:putative ATP-grasp target RiPP
MMRDRLPGAVGRATRRAAELPEVGDNIPFGLTRATIVRPTQVEVRSKAQVIYDPAVQMSRIKGGGLVVMANKTDVYCQETTTEDNQRYQDRVVDDSKDDA